ncbi:RING-HC finger protein, partial [archaeon]
VLAMGTPAIFALFLILTLTVSQGYRDSGDAIIILVFLALVLDFLSGCVSFYYGARLYMYERACKKADDATAAAALVAAASPPSTAGAALSPPVSAAAMPAMPDTAAARAARRLGLQEQVVEGGAVVPPNVASSFVHLLPADAVPVPASPNAGATAVHAPASQPVMPMHSSALADSGLCAICMELPRNTAFYPCGHMCCAGCASTLMRHSTHCHLCRRRITSTLRVYL